MHKRILSTIFAAMLIFSITAAMSVTASAQSLKYGDYQYTVLDNGCVSIEGYTGFAESIHIPEKIDGRTVTQIAPSAFENRKLLKEVTIPESVISIGDGAFYNTALYNDEANWETGALYIGSNLIATKLRIWDGENYKYDVVTEIDVYYDIKEGTRVIADNAFESGKLKKISFPDSVEYIGKRAFLECNLIKSVEIPDSVKFIETGAFENCENLRTVQIGSGVTRIDRKAFYNTGLWNNKTKWENGLLYIGDYLLGAKKDELAGNISIKDGTKLIAENTFFYCKSLTDVALPDSLKYIGDYAFVGCESLANAVIPNSVENIGNYAFYRCKSLNNVTIPSSVTCIGDYAFGYAYDNGYNKIADFHIECYADSVGEKYAADNGFDYTSNEADIKFGDANSDGKVTAADVLLIRKSIAGQSVTFNSNASDVNCDGKLTAADVLMIRKYIAGQPIVLGK